jgi:hypothetical protein
MIYEIVYYISMISIIPAAYLAIRYNNNLHQRTLRILAAFVIFSACAEAVMYVTSRLNINNSILSGLHCIIELLLIGLYYSHSFWNKKLRYFYLAIWMVFSFFMLWSLYLHPLDFPVLGKAVQNMLVVTFTIINFILWIRQSMEWIYELYIMLGLFLYYLMSSITFFYFDIGDRAIEDALWIMHNFLNILVNSLIMLALKSYLYRYGKPNIS